MRKLTAALLFLVFLLFLPCLPFLTGANASTAALRDYTAAIAGDHIAPGTADYAAPGTGGHAAPAASACTMRAAGSSSSGAPATQPFLPAHVSAGAFSVPTALVEPGAADAWRTPTRCGRSHTDPLRAGDPTVEARTHIHLLQRRMLEVERTLARARTNDPASFGNPPPTSQT